MRDELLAKYSGKWVAVHKGRVVAVADEPLSIMDQALAEDGYAYSNKVGDEDKIVIRQRRGSNTCCRTKPSKHSMVVISLSPLPIPQLRA